MPFEGSKTAKSVADICGSFELIVKSVSAGALKKRESECVYGHLLSVNILSVALIFHAFRLKSKKKAIFGRQ